MIQKGLVGSRQIFSQITKKAIFNKFNLFKNQRYLNNL